MLVTDDCMGCAIKAVSLTRGGRTVFQGLDVNLQEHRIGLIGHNGAGKTSLLRLLCGLETPHAGQVLVQGQDIYAHKPTMPRARLIGMMFQNPEDQIIFPTVEEELALSLQTLSGLGRKAARQSSHAFLETYGLQHWASRSIGSLSQGQRQWVCWLAMLLAQPQVLLLDEPFASLDLPGQIALAHAIDTCAQQVIVSTHALDHVRGFERVIWLDAGRICADGPGDEVCRAYESAVQAQAPAWGVSSPRST
ncbi:MULTISPECIES: energy-coupling factor ABC transporter ATP-binding protein [Giesbergeria]|uniref:Energy-coupling factor ABC transporter ATP-binding protein n=1 Tax=Giesbergeria sinuosa TaxID=80883 RepID=A0ABV9QAF9_9BURK